MFSATSRCSKFFESVLEPSFSRHAISFALSWVNDCNICKPFVTVSTATASASVTCSRTYLIAPSRTGLRFVMSVV